MYLKKNVPFMEKIKKDCLGIILLNDNFDCNQQRDESVLLNKKNLIAQAMDLIHTIGVNTICVGKNVNETMDNSYNFSRQKKFIGALGEIRSVLNNSDYSAFKTALIIPYDMLFLTEKILNYLFESMEFHRAVCYKESNFPLLLKIDSFLIKLLNNFLNYNNNNEKTLEAFLSKLSAKYLNFSLKQKKLFSNIKSDVNLKSKLTEFKKTS